MNDNEPPDWKLKLRYGHLKTDFTHYTLLADGRFLKDCPAQDCPAGPAIMGLKIWASCHEEAVQVLGLTAEGHGFQVAGDIQIFETDPVKPPGGEAYGYDVNFNSYAD